VNWLKFIPYGAGALGLVLALVFFGLMRGAQGQRDAARAELKTMTLAFDAEKLSTKGALDALQRVSTDLLDSERRCATALAGMRAEADKLRVTLRSCQSDDAVADRIGGLFP